MIDLPAPTPAVRLLGGGCYEEYRRSFPSHWCWRFPRPRAAPPPEGDALQAIAPYVTEQTLLVVRMDVARLDVTASSPWPATASARPWRVTRLRTSRPHRLDSDQLKNQARQWSAQFAKAGGREFFALYGLMDLHRGTPLVVVPMPASGGDAAAIIRLMTAAAHSLAAGLAADGRTRPDGGGRQADRPGHRRRTAGESIRWPRSSPPAA